MSDKQDAREVLKELLNQAVADLSVAHSILHQIHWYLRGPGFMNWHPKMDDYMSEVDETLDEVAERLIILGGSPLSTLKELSEQSKLTEQAGRFDVPITSHLERLVEVFRYLVNLYQAAMVAAEDSGDDVTNDIFVGAKASLEKHIWFLQAELGQAPQL